MKITPFAKNLEHGRLIDNAVTLTDSYVRGASIASVIFEATDNGKSIAIRFEDRSEIEELIKRLELLVGMMNLAEGFATHKNSS